MKDENLSMKIDVYPMVIKTIEETFNSLKDTKEYIEIIREIKELGEKNKLN
ncbi:MAG: hypothetical protein ACRCXT_10665 [Paraclostridium sp.]